MKPRLVLAETRLSDDSLLEWQEHDGRHYLSIAGQQIDGPNNEAVQRELAHLACAPFRPARQPKILIAGLGLGTLVDALTQNLLQKRATFIVTEPLAEIVTWNRKFIPEGVFATDARVKVESDATPSGIASHNGTLHAILTHLDTAPLYSPTKPWPEQARWLTAAYDALQPGGMLAIAGSRVVRNMSRNLQRAGFQVAEHEVPSSTKAKRPRLHPIWLARKSGKGEE